MCAWACVPPVEEVLLEEEDENAEEKSPLDGAWYKMNQNLPGMPTCRPTPPITAKPQTYFTVGCLLVCKDKRPNVVFHILSVFLLLPVCSHETGKGQKG